MAAAWHNHSQPAFLGYAPQFSFNDVARLIQPAPYSQQASIRSYARWEKRMGAAWFEQIEKTAQARWLAKRPWWLAI